MSAVYTPIVYRIKVCAITTFFSNNFQHFEKGLQKGLGLSQYSHFPGFVCPRAPYSRLFSLLPLSCTCFCVLSPLSFRPLFSALPKIHLKSIQHSQRVQMRTVNEKKHNENWRTLGTCSSSYVEANERTRRYYARALSFSQKRAKILATIARMGMGKVCFFLFRLPVFSIISLRFITLAAIR